MAYFSCGGVSAVLKSSFTSSKLWFSVRCFLATEKLFELIRGPLIYKKVAQ